MRGIEGERLQICDRCGGDALRPATRRDQLVHWFTHGSGVGTAWYCRTCGASWSGSSSYSALSRTSGSGWRRRARLPLEVLAAVRDARRWHPMPLFYAAVGGVALVPAVVVAAFTGIGWWVALLGVPVVAMVGVFLWSLATAVGRGRREVLWRLAPERAWREEMEEELVGLRAQIGSFPLLEPDGWSGSLSLDGVSWSIPARSPRVLQEVTVVADQGDPLLDPDRLTLGWRPATPRVEIRCTRDGWQTPEEHALHEFVERAFPAPPVDLEGVEPADSQEMERRMLAAHLEREESRLRFQVQLSDCWSDGTVPVDGVAIAARLLTHDAADVEVATFTFYGHRLLLIAEGLDLDMLPLVRVADPTPLVDEFEVRRDQGPRDPVTDP